MSFLDLLSQYGPDFLRSLGTTLELVGISVLVGGAFALPIAAGRMSGNRFVRKGFYAYTYLFRGTPLLAQVFLLYYGAGKFRPELQAIHIWWIFRDSFWCAVLAFGANTSAYQAEIWRGALQAVPWGQWEAAHALGVSRKVAFLRVILPQATLIALRPLGNELILMLKASSIASVIAVHEVMGATGIAFARTFDFQFYLWAAVLYLVMVEGIRRLWTVFENRLSRHVTKPEPRSRKSRPNPTEAAIPSVTVH
jgi:polar amino acid transport system permease protein